MKKLLSLLFLVFGLGLASANAQLAKFQIAVPSPTGACSIFARTFSIDSTNHVLKYCDGSWQAAGGATGATGATGAAGPTGATGGTLTASCSGASVGVNYVCQFSLTSTQVKTLFSVPVSIIDSPGVGKLTNLKSSYTNYVFGTIPYGPSDFIDAYLDSGNVLAGFGCAGSSPTSVVGSLGLDQLVSSYTVDNAVCNSSVNFSLVSANANKALFIKMRTADPNTIGAIDTSSVGTGGTGYANGDTGTVSGCGTGDATYQVTTNLVGVVTAFTITSQGSFGQQVTTGCPTTVSTGTGDGTFTIDINSITPGDGTISGSFYYTIENAN